MSSRQNMEIYGRWGFRTTKTKSTVFEICHDGHERPIAEAVGNDHSQKEANARVIASGLFLADTTMQESLAKESNNKRM